MTSAIVPYKTEKFSPSSSERNKELFPFFNLPELVVEKILKEYISVSDKAILSQMPEFKSYYELRYFWFQPTLHLFELVRSLKPGWYLDYENLDTRYYITIDYFNLSFNIYIFCIALGDCRSPLHIGPIQKNLSQMQVIVNKINENNTFTLAKENDILVYHLRRQDLTDMLNTFSCRYIYIYCTYFWILRPQKQIFWPQNNTYYPLKNNKCVIPNGIVDSYNVVLKLNDDFTVRVYQVKRFTKQLKLSSNILCDTILSPLSFQICNDDFSSDQESNCKSCKNNPNSIHPICRQTFKYINENNVSMSVTHFYSNYCFQTRFVKDYMFRGGRIFFNHEHQCFFEEVFGEIIKKNPIKHFFDDD